MTDDMRSLAGLLKTVMLALALWLIAAAGAQADRRVALVIGNSSYQKVTPLPNPRNDAADVADVLRKLDFDVISVIDSDHVGFNRALGEFSRRAIDADAALFFYAGHGIQVRGQNFLLPVDADAKDEVSAEFEFVALERVRAALDRAAPGAVRIMILDACRDNPLARSAVATRGVSATRGLARIDLESVGGLVVVYATQPNQVAQDGAERNSPFTSALLARLNEPGLEVGALFRRVTNDVRQKTQGKQIPELSISLGQDYYLNRNETDALAFDRIADSGDPQDFRNFLARYPGSARAPLARRMVEMLESNIAQRRQEVAAKDSAPKDSAQKDSAQKDSAQKDSAQKDSAQKDSAQTAQADAVRLAEEARRQAEAARLAAEQARAEAAQRAAERQRLETAALAAQSAERDRLAREAAALAARQRLEAASLEARAQEARAQEARAQEARAQEARAQEARAPQINAQDSPAQDAPALDASPQDAKAPVAPAPPPGEIAEIDRKRMEADRRTAELIAAQARAQESMRLAQSPGATGRSAVNVAALAAPPPAAEFAGTPDLLRAAQVQLKRLGCYAGPANGRSTPAMRAALTAYARQSGTIEDAAGVTAALVEALRARPAPVCGAPAR